MPRTAPMRTIAVLPIKNFGAAKQRLAGAVGGGSRRALAQAMFSDVLSSLRHVRGIEAIAVVTADRDAESAAYSDRVHVLRDTAQAGQSQAALIGIRYALAAGFARALLVPGDTPLLDVGEIEGVLRRGEERELQVVVVPDRHGTGTNALLLVPPDAMEPSFGPGSFERHMATASSAGLRHGVERVPSLLLDVDTPADLAELSGLLGGRRGQAPMTRGTLAQLDRLQVRAPVAAA